MAEYYNIIPNHNHNYKSLPHPNPDGYANPNLKPNPLNYRTLGYIAAYTVIELKKNTSLLGIKFDKNTSL